MENVEQNEVIEKGAEQSETLEMTRSELNALLQKESDRRVSKALETARKNWEKDIDDKMNNHLKDYERKAQMTPAELRQLDLEDKFKLLEEKEQKYNRMTREREIEKVLQKKGLSTVLCDFVYDNDMDVVEQKIATLEQLILGMVNEQIELRISSSKPRASVKTEGLDKERFSSLSIAERAELYRQDPELFKKLSK